ncbi:MAG: asparagine synthase C-terminal domain-containing protein [Bacteroidota bacterium]
MQFEPTRPYFPHWQQLSKGYCCGQVYAAGRWLSAKEVEQQLERVTDLTTLRACLAGWNGFFALYWEGPNATYAVTDIARSIPLFWRVDDGEVTVRDQLSPQGNTPTRWFSEAVLTQTEFVPGHMTLAFGWQQLQAGEILEIRDGLVYLHEWFSHRRPAEVETDEVRLQAEFIQLIKAQTQRLIDWAAGRPIVVPLSGGYDSRYLLAALRQAKYDNLRAFTYGQAGSWEVELAEKTAAQLGVEWRFVAYNNHLLRAFWSDDWTAFSDYAGNCVTIPQEQDYFALRALRDDGWLTEDSIICPGYCGDFQAGSYLPGTYFKLPWRQGTAALQRYLYHQFQRYPARGTYEFWQPILPQQVVQNEHEIVSELEHWVLREYVTKFIVNGVRAYEWVGCQWYLPQWDRAFIEFWQRVPNSYRQDMRLYRQTLRQAYFVPLGIDFPEDRAGDAVKRNPLAAVLGVATKAFLKGALFANNAPTNINGLHQLVPQIQQKLGWETIDTSKTLNEMIGHWYLSRLKSQFTSNDSTTLT